MSITKAALYKGFYRIQRVSLFVTLTLVHYCTGVSIWKLVYIVSLHLGGLLRFHAVYMSEQGFLGVNEAHRGNRSLLVCDIRFSRRFSL